MTYRSENSDQYFKLKERARKLAKKSHSIARTLMNCCWCYGAGSVAACTYHIHKLTGEAIKRKVEPLELLPCVCTVGWPDYKQGDDYDG